MSADLDFSFPHDFSCEALAEIPSGRPLQWHYFPGGQASGQDGVMVLVRPLGGDDWAATFSFGKLGSRGVSRILSMPNPDILCVVARGAGYLVSVSCPTNWEAVRAIPIVDVRVIPAAKIVVFASFTELLAYSAEGVKWRTKRLAWDGFQIVEITDNTLVGEYWDIRSEETEKFEVDLLTGASRGGVET